MNESIDQRMHLTPAQVGIWMGHQLAGKGSAFNTGESLEICGAIDIKQLRDVLEETLAGCEALHQRFTYASETLWQVPVSRNPSIDVYDWRKHRNPDVELNQTIRACLDTPFDLETGPLYRAFIARLQADRTVFFLAAHHIALDGHGYSNIRTQIRKKWRANGEGRAGWPIPVTLRQVVDDETAYPLSEQYFNDQHFWRASMNGVEGIASWSGSEKPRVPARPVVFEVELGEGVSQAMKTRSKRDGYTWFEMFLSAVAEALGVESEGEMILGVPMMGGLGSLALQIPCMSMNIVPIRLGSLAGLRWQDGWNRVHTALERARAHARYRYEDIRRDLGLAGTEGRLFGPVVNFIPWAEHMTLGDIPCRVRSWSAGPVEDLSITIRGGFLAPKTVSFEGHPENYDKDDLADIASSVLSSLRGATEKSPERVKQGSSRARVWMIGRSLEVPPKDVVTALEQWANERPEAIAIEGHGVQWTYAQLMSRARGAAAQFRRQGAQPGDIVAIIADRAPRVIAAMFGVMMIGCTYLPLDPKGPRPRIQDMLHRARPRFVCGIEQTSLSELCCDTAIETLLLTDSEDTSNKTNEFGRVAYLLFTSGSTGRPNGVWVARDALAHFVSAAAQCYGWSETDRVLQFAPLHFDASIEEIMVCLTRGGTLVLRTDAMLESMDIFLDTCRAWNITVLDLPTAFWHELTYRLVHDRSTLPSSIRSVVIGGEAALQERVDQWRDVVGRSVELWNTYGPTETTVVATASPLHLAPRGRAVAIGQPLPGVTVSIAPHEKGVRGPGNRRAGELRVHGPTVGLGYLDAPKRMAEVFAEDESGRYYRTGDLVRVDAHGELEFLGRIDDEVKISGQRVDPHEVETVLLRETSLKDVVVVATQGQQPTRLAAFYVECPDSDHQESELRAICRDHLLACAVPTRFIALSGIPRTSSGKIDRNALRAQAEKGAESERVVVSGEDPLVDKVLRVWWDVLGDTSVAADQDVFGRGAQSLQTIQVANRLSVQLKRSVEVAWLFRYPTARQLAARLNENAVNSEKDVRAQMAADTRLLEGLQVAEPRLHLEYGQGRRLLVTGATGFVGVHIVDQLLRRGFDRLICVVRCRDRADGIARISAAMRTYGLELGDSLDRIDVVAGDMSVERFGWSEAQFNDLCMHCDGIIHSAASVNLMRPYMSLRDINVLGIREVIRFAAHRRRKWIVAMSTLAVMPPDAPCERFSPIHDGLRDGYTQSKWVAEQLLSYAGDSGIPTRILRLGRITGPERTSTVNPQDIIWRMIRVGLAHGALPQLDVSEVWTPADDIGRAVVELIDEGWSGTEVLNVAPHEPVRLADVFQTIRACGYRFEDVSVARWLDRITSVESADQATRALLTGLKDGVPSGWTTIEARRLAEVLSDRGFEWSRVDERLIARYLKQWMKEVESGVNPPQKVVL